jgi:predicted metal-dependent enzyme (double-stranded beta helix superfamily)
MSADTSTAERLGPAFADYVARLQAAWSTDDIPERAESCRQAMERLLGSEEPEWIAEMDRVAQAERPVELYRDASTGFIQMAHPYRPGHASPPHGHGAGAWVVYGLQRGEVEIATYRRTGGDPPLEISRSEVLGPGEARTFLPGELHSVRLVSEARAGGPGVVLRLLSEDLSKLDRPRYEWQDVVSEG